MSSVVSWPRSLSCMLLSAALIRLSFPTFDWGALILVAWVPFLWAARAAGWRRALVLGFIHGFCLGLVAHHWVVPAISRHSDLPAYQAVVALLAIAALCGLRSAAVAVALSFGVRRGLPLWLSFPVFLACAELLLPGFFPWTNALAVHAMPVWSQAAAWGGATLVSAWLSLTNALLAEGLVRWLQARRARAGVVWLAGAVGVVSLMTSLGNWSVASQLARAATAPRLRLAIAHAVSPSSDQAELIPTLRALSVDHQLRVGESDLVLWPEGVTPMPLRLAEVTETARRYWLRDRQKPPSAPQLQAHLLLGISLGEPDGLRNAALLLGPGGRYLGAYTKQNLVPIGETGLLPQRVSNGALGQGVTSYRSDVPLTTLSVAGHALSVSICFEDILSEAVRSEVLRTQGELLVNLTSDRWFEGTSAVAFHFALAKLRAVEHGKYLVRATLDGISGVVDSAGNVAVSAAGGPSRIVAAEVPLLAGLTPYARWAAWLRVGWLGLGMLLLVSSSLRSPTGRRTR